MEKRDTESFRIPTIKWRAVIGPPLTVGKLDHLVRENEQNHRFLEKREKVFTICCYRIKHEINLWLLKSSVRASLIEALQFSFNRICFTLELL